MESVETVKDVEKQLSGARAKLQAFEDGVDRARLLKRLKTSSPAHPVLLFRGLLMFLTILILGAALVVLVIPWVNSDLARKMARFDAVIPVPPDIPGLPALLGLLAACMFVGWLMATLAALAMGRDAQMLPWEQKKHQKLVNEVTRLTTQKAVMERMRSTPAGARPRMETPVPVSLRDRAGMATPSALGRLGESGTPPGLGRLAPAIGGGGGNPFGRAPGSAAPEASGGGGGGLFGRGGLAGQGDAPVGDAPGNAAGGGVLARARSGALKTTPAGAAGRLTPNFNRPSGAGGGRDEEGSDDSNPFGGSGTAFSAAATTAGAPPSSNPFSSRAPAASNPFGGTVPASNNPFSSTPPASSNPFGGVPGSAAPASGGRLADGAAEPPPSSSPFGGGAAGGHASPAGNPFGGGSAGGLLARARAGGDPGATSGGLPAIVESQPGYSANHTTPASAERQDDATSVFGESHRGSRNPVLPRWGAISDPWLEEAVERVEKLAHDLPAQAHLSFSEETYLPFTLVIARATPAVAVKALVAYVEYLSTIPTPPRARVELNASPGLDRSFHRNVEAALQPIFGDDFEVDLEPGRVEVTFKQPDEAWQDYPVLPTK